MANKKIPMRQCVGCREMKSKRELIRVIRTSEDEILVDATGKQNGRGAYICPNRECLEKAMKSKGLERSLKIAVPQKIYEDFEKEMESIETR
ncbi:MAG: YlxR family protein [Lachnospiraceae bacterium]|nr:YlxR family protein [Lachnospiraceae bacterium]